MKMILIQALLFVIISAHLGSRVAAELKMLTQSENFTVNPDHTVVLPCVIQDQGTKKAVWRNLKDGTNISVNFEILSHMKSKYVIERPQDSGAFAWNLRINNVVDMDQGHYQCVVGDAPEVSVTHFVIVEGADVIPTHNNSENFNVTECCIREKVSSSCLPVCHPSNMSADINVLTACASDLNKVVTCGTDGRNHVGCCKRRGIPDMCLDFCYGVIPSNLDTQHLTCLTQLPDILSCLEEGHVLLPGPPTAVSVVQSSADQASVLVTWRPPIQNPQLVKGYKVFYKVTSDTHYKSTRIISSSEQMYLQSGLQLNVQYSVYMVALGDYGSSQPSETFIFTLLPAQPKSDIEADILGCCISKGLKNPCLSKLCTPDLMRNVNPVEILWCSQDLNKALQCLVGQRDHSACCKRNSLPDVCLPFCAGQGMNLTLDYMSCVIRLPVIEACVQEGRATIPGPPVNVSVVPGIREAVVSWNNVGAPAMNFTIFYRVLGMDKMPWNRMEVSASPADLQGLYPGTHYEIQLAAANENGSSLLSTKVVFLTYENVITTPAPTLPSEIHNLTVCCSEKRVRSDCMSFCSFDKLASGSLDFGLAYSCIDVLDDIIACASDGRNHKQCCKRSGVPETCDNICQFSPHDELSTDFLLCAGHVGTIANCYREGLATLPRQPQNFTVLKYTSHTVYLAWRQPKATSTGIESYSVIYHPKNQTDLTQWKTLSTKNLEVIVNDLKPSTEYFFQVVSVNENGTSAPTPELRVLTKAYDDDKETLRCNFTMKNNTDVKTDGVGQRKLMGTVEECKSYCSVPQCQGFTYSSQYQACTLFMDKAPLKPFASPGYDFYNHSCPPRPDIIPTGNWSMPFHNRTDCCQNANISDNCMNACMKGEFQSVYRCEDDYPKILTCAADGRDHTACCKNLAVPELCLSYCQGQLSPTTGVGALCLNYIPSYVQCFVNGSMYLPTPPGSVIVKIVNGTAAMLSWETPTVNCDSTTGCHYVVFLVDEKGGKLQNRTKETSLLFTDLSPQTVYSVFLLAVNNYGKSIQTPQMKFVTPPLVPFADISVSQTPSYPPSENGEVELFCNVYSAGRTFPFVYWVRNSKIIRKGRQLKMSMLSERDEGNYTCSAKDDRGVVTNFTHFLRIMYKPKAVRLMGNSYFPGQMQVANLQCDFMGYPTKIKWFKGRDELPVTQFGQFFHTTEKLVSYPTHQRSILSIYYVVDEAFDRYTCVGYNDFGNGSGVVELSNALLTRPPPPTPTYPTTRNVSQCCVSYEIPRDCMGLCSTFVNLDEVTAQPDKYGHCLAYLQFYTACATDGKDHSKCCSKKGVHPFCHTFCAGFVPDDMGSIFLMNCITDAPLMLECVQENLEFIPSSPALTALQRNDVIQVNWDKPEDNAHRVDRYELYWLASDTPSSSKHVSLVNTLTDYRIKKLRENVNYTVWVIAANEKGSSQPINKKSVLVKNLRPSAPQELHVSEMNGESVLLKWDPPENHAVVTNYTILYREANMKDQFKQVVVPGSVRTYLISNLKPRTLYEFQLVANGPFGKSDTAKLGSEINTGPSTSANRNNGPDRSGMPLGIGLTLVAVLIVAGMVAAYLYCRRRRKMNYGETVSFENPQYGSRVQISGLPNSNDSSDEGFGYAPLREDHDVEHRPTDKSNLRDENTMDVAIS
uniref:Ig-like and fibronectin type-III domain-containing protein 2 n=1 Tax=Crassostrea virginica TaxID=6565 RepID=A0A8B8CS00_CRAVI|nr:Ig-like and fibronectin type-III domain-containing protein 2 [Crassostrea virginica]XP_022317211.1 Ig-like and fibronectin type-III domain-containing protein 2 [Crassostrea virginica]